MNESPVEAKKESGAVANQTTDPLGGAALAEQAYAIYRGIKREGPPIAHWQELTREEQGAFVWVARFALLSVGKMTAPPNDAGGPS